MQRFAHVLVLCLVLIPALAIAASPPGPSTVSSARQGRAFAHLGWVTAVVLRRDGKKLVLVGSVEAPVAPPSLDDGLFGGGIALSVARNPPSQADYEVWLVGRKRILGIGYSSTRHEYAPLGAPWSSAAHRDDGHVARVVAGAQRVRRATVASHDASFDAAWPTPVQSAHGLCTISQVVATGQVVGVFRMAHSPVNSTNVEQHTVYLFAVEQYLKTDDAARPFLLKVWNEGGDLPWSSPRGTVGRGYIVPADPGLNVGRRYILFLRSQNQTHQWDGLGYVPAQIHGVEGMNSALDEYVAADHWRGKLALVAGYTRAPSSARDSDDLHWRFAFGPQILDVPEARAVQVIQQECAAVAGPP